MDNLWKAIEAAALHKREELVTDQASEDRVRGFFDRFIRADFF